MWNILNKYFFYYPVATLKTKGFLKAQRELEVSQMVQPEPIQVEKLQRLIFFSQKNIPYYVDRLKDIPSNSIRSLSDLTKLPTLDKITLKKSSEHFVSQNNTLLCTKKTTGGSTGQPLTIIKSRFAMAYELAATWRGYSWAGISIGDKQARFWGVPMTWKGRMSAKITDIICNRHRLSAFSFNQQSLAGYTDQLNKFKPDYFYGYVSMLVEFADYILQNSISLNFCPKAIVTTSEVLYPKDREKLKKAFHCNQIYDEYGCGEVGTIAHECEAGSLHISAENMVIEILNADDVPCKEGEVGEIVVTELNNYAMPLIRYRLGDYATISTKRCVCGRMLPVLSNIKGRAYDVVKLANGKKYHGEYFMYVMEAAEKKKLGIVKFQIVQKSLTSIQVRIVPGTTYNDDSEKFIIKGIKRDLPDNIDVHVVLVKEIHREKSGKMRLIVGL